MAKKLKSINNDELILLIAFTFIIVVVLYALITTI